MTAIKHNPATIKTTSRSKLTKCHIVNKLFEPGSIHQKDWPTIDQMADFIACYFVWHLLHKCKTTDHEGK